MRYILTVLFIILSTAEASLAKQPTIDIVCRNKFGQEIFIKIYEQDGKFVGEKIKLGQPQPFENLSVDDNEIRYEMILKSEHSLDIFKFVISRSDGKETSAHIHFFKGEKIRNTAPKFSAQCKPNKKSF